MKTFLKMVKYEMIRVSRNKVVLTMLLTFSIALLLILSFVQIDKNNYPIAVFTDGVNMEEVGVVEVIEENIELNKVKIVGSKEKGLELIKKGKVCFFICLQAGETVDDTTAIFYYDQTSTVGRGIKNNISDAKNEYAYTTIKEFLSKYGITLKENYFDLVSFEPASSKSINIKQKPFAMEVGTCVSIVLMFGIAYSMARDNETSVSRNLSYMPVGTNRYLMSKVLPYAILGITQITVLYLIGGLFFKIVFETPLILMILLSSVFVLAVVCLALIFSTLKSQIATIFCGMLTIVLPIFILTMIYIQASSILLQIFLYSFPIVPFVNVLNAMMFNGVVLWWQIGIMVIQSIAYYLIAMLIVKKKIKE